MLQEFLVDNRVPSSIRWCRKLFESRCRTNWTIAHRFENIFGSMVQAVPLTDVIRLTAGGLREPLKILLKDRNHG